MTRQGEAHGDLTIRPCDPVEPVGHVEPLERMRRRLVGVAGEPCPHAAFGAGVGGVGGTVDEHMQVSVACGHPHALKSLGGGAAQGVDQLCGYVVGVLEVVGVGQLGDGGLPVDQCYVAFQGQVGDLRP
ncbi:hypothetical protein [Actinomadura madurae]|uniref:hypothetical protein n=1 Tax=Actinomadura madurae TaxID=1993 RepID=UPI0020D21230|nr:hypothetical protein [Actinomadura madurae]MCQ0012095.1 hypothetical protein [Actinomadura madurae]